MSPSRSSASTITPMGVSVSIGSFITCSTSISPRGLYACSAARSSTPPARRRMLRPQPSDVDRSVPRAFEEHTDLHAIAHRELGEDLLEMRLHGARGDVQRRADLLVRG